MDTLDRLEDSVRRFIEAYARLREEREHLSGELLLVGAELEQARETVANLRAGNGRSGDADDRLRELEVKKDELRENVRRIIEKIDGYAGSDETDTAAVDSQQTAHAFPANLL